MEGRYARPSGRELMSRWMWQLIGMAVVIVLLLVAMRVFFELRY